MSEPADDILQRDRFEGGSNGIIQSLHVTMPAVMGERRASAVSEAASARRAAATLFLSSIMSIFMRLGI